jgi:RNA 2',3'-cyclic 3'-phosphodiesterase
MADVTIDPSNRDPERFGMPRLFAGLEIPPVVASALSALRGGLAGARWIEPPDYHITLRFIGDIGNRQADDIHDLLQDVNRRALSLKLSGLGTFGGDQPQSIYASVEPSDALSDLHNEIERICRSCGAMPDRRRFQPHVTLARLRGAFPLDIAQFLSERGYFPPQSFTADRFVLFSARASVGGGPYMVETSYPLRRAALV